MTSTGQGRLERRGHGLCTARCYDAAGERWRIAETELWTRFLTWGAKSLDDSARHLELCVSEQTKPERTRYYLAAELPRSGEVMGDAGFEWVDRKQREGRRGYVLAGPLA